ncbi:IPT/TIG domain-containing protein [Dictyostelium discoideum AX4]|uniref:IPT/TIG domain-containing protein n=1 Tax=Dictyostelium discoideum TaxID=44689 RepID=V9H176_DICDI|nr:IPT/TIG domain-containing protein [Dictyostelium discoideum AX4]EAL71642.2 IPT/TIG domain-containing protein [Dictyostelium discoideum AX4]|eukprot:XP_645603.2 IPT/TIG domain-containing protein [Dictyostelium discoideum AX4]
MKIKYISIFVILIYKFLFSKPECIFTKDESPNSLVVTKLNCTKQVESFTLYDNKAIEVSLEKAADGYYFDILNYPYKNKLYDISALVFFIPEISSFPKMPTTGGNFNFEYNLAYRSNGMVKPIILNGVNFWPIYNSTLDLFNIQIPKGCGILKFYYDNRLGKWNFFDATYEMGSIPVDPLLDGEGSFTIKGSNLFNTSIEIFSKNDIYSNRKEFGIINDDHTEVKFSINEARYQGLWKIDVKICDTFYRSYTFSFSPELIRMEGVLNNNGGNVTFTGNHLRSKQNVTGTFGNKRIECFNTNSSKSITCTLPTRKNYGFLGYNIPLTVTIDGEYTSNTIKISYDLPLIQNVQQRGNSQIFNVTGVYLSKVIVITVITGMSMKTNITKMNSTSTLEEPGFFIESNNTIFIFLPNNTQPGFMELAIEDGDESFRAPRYNFKITPTITDGQSFKSNTPGDDLKIKGIFMRTVDFDGRDIPLTFESEPDGPICIHSKDGDGLSFTCVLKSGFGSNHTINIYYNLLQIGSFNVSYNPPQLTEVYQEKNGNIKINGYNLGDSIKDSIITVVFSGGITLNGTVIASGHEYLIFGYPVGNKKTASYRFQLGDQQSNMLEQYTLKPIIENSDPAVPCGGGMVTINGHYFFDYAKDTTTVTIGKVVCNISSINVTTIECTIAPNLRSLSPRYTSGSKRLLITSSSADTERMYNYQLPSAGYYYKFEPPTITNTSSIDQTALITIYGTSFGDSNLEILIDGKPCTQHEIDIHTYSSVSCNVTNYAEMLKYNYSDTKFNISISVDGQYFIAEIFQFKCKFYKYIHTSISQLFIYYCCSFRYLDNLRLKVRAKHATQISKHYTFGDQRAPKGPKSPYYDFLKKLSRFPLIRRYFKEHND